MSRGSSESIETPDEDGVKFVLSGVEHQLNELRAMISGSAPCDIDIFSNDGDPARSSQVAQGHQLALWVLFLVVGRHSCIQNRGFHVGVKKERERPGWRWTPASVAGSARELRNVLTDIRVFRFPLYSAVQQRRPASCRMRLYVRIRVKPLAILGQTVGYASNVRSGMPGNFDNPPGCGGNVRLALWPLGQS